MHPVHLYTDGAASGNPGPGGYAAILTYHHHEKVITGGYARTTNNRMELIAVIAGLAALTQPRQQVAVYTDSRYVVDAITKEWLKNWLASPNFKKKKNEDLWRRLHALLSQHQVAFFWVKGHNGHAYNERCDRLAVAMTKKQNLPPDKGYQG